ncbi:hypothetical protein ACF0H5_006479 [Mactra antiquata]
MVNITDGKIVNITMEDLHLQCLQAFFWKFMEISWSALNITEDDKAYINSLMGSYVHRGRQKRQAGPRRIFPLTGFRVRREYRRLSDGQRFAYHAAVNTLKTNGRYDTFANLHQGVVITSAHNGPNFLPWHRVYLALYEEALRMVNRMVSLPYWDSTLDFHMAEPTESIIWSTPFLGNGDGIVTAGPFANWVTPTGPLARNIGGGSRLFSRPVVNDILTRCRMRDIVVPTALPRYNLELHHGGPHNWVGGQMMGLNTAAHDPVFFMLHAYVDYIWELFRIGQATRCGINPSIDYPMSMGQHAPNRPMDGFPQYRNIDGIREYWIRFWYRYEYSPTCAPWRPFCGSPYLRCDIPNRRCISEVAMEARQRSNAGGGFAAFGGMAAGAVAGMASAQAASALRARSEAARAVEGPTFPAPPADPRTQDGARMVAANFRVRRQASRPRKQYNGNRNDTNARLFTSLNFGPVFQAPPDDVRNNRRRFSTNRITNFDRFSPHQAFAGFGGPKVFNGAKPMPLLPLPDYHAPGATHSSRSYSGNSFSINSIVDVNKWAFIPVRVNYEKNSQNSNIKPNCQEDISGIVKVKVQSSGINYDGKFTDHGLIDQTLNYDSKISYIGIKTPEYNTTKVIVSASHSCGLMCEPYCLTMDQLTQSPYYRACTGVLKLSQNDVQSYGLTYDEVKQLARQQIDGIERNKIRMYFACSNIDVSL